MPQKRQSRKKTTKTKNINLPVAISIAVVFSCYLIVTFLQGKGWDGWIPDWNEIFKKPVVTTGQSTDTTPLSGDVLVHYIDVGQADSMLIQAGDANILIDAADNGTTEELMAYLKPLNLDEIDLMITTHPHADHIGGADAVLKAYTVKEFWMPKLPDSLVPTTRTFSDVLDQLDAQKLDLTYPKPGATRSIGGGTLAVLGPVGEYDDLNNYSLVVKYTYGENSFLFTGDMEKDAEEDLLAAKVDLSADVLKMGHHGSSSSSTKEFTTAVGASYYIMEVGADNKYGHPHKETLDFLKASKKPYYRTDLNGTVIVSGDGKDYTFQTTK